MRLQVSPDPGFSQVMTSHVCTTADTASLSIIGHGTLIARLDEESGQSGTAR